MLGKKRSILAEFIVLGACILALGLAFGVWIIKPVATLRSLERIDDYPLYTLTYYGSYERARGISRVVAGHISREPSNISQSTQAPAWACSLFAAFGDAISPVQSQDLDNVTSVYGRNFDWEYSPAMLVYTDPPDGYASVSMVDLAYLVDVERAKALDDTHLLQRRALLSATEWPFDGMNAHGLVVGMAAVPKQQMPYDPNKETLGSLQIIREMLDHARNVNEALDIIHRHNIDMQGGPTIHYLIADRSGQAALVEFIRGETVITRNASSWHHATNFLRATVETPDGQCRRYDHLTKQLTACNGNLSPSDALSLLSEVSQSGTQWSVVYEMQTGRVNIAMGKAYDNVHTLYLQLEDN